MVPRHRGQALLAGAALAVAVLTGCAGQEPSQQTSTTSRNKTPNARNNSATTLKPRTTTGRELFALPVPDGIAHGEPVSAPDAWAAPDTYVTTAPYAIQAHDPLTGAEQWHVPLPGPVCRGSETMTSDGKVALVFKATRAENGYCNRLAVIDTHRGTLLWQHPLPGKGTKGMGLTVAVTDTTAAAAWNPPGSSTSGALGYSLDGTRQLWNKPRPDTDLGSSLCGEEYTGGTWLHVTRGCVSDGMTFFSLHRIDPATGKTLWTYRAREPYAGLYLAESNPMVLAVYDKRDKTADEPVLTHATRLITLADDGTEQTEIPIKDLDAGCSAFTGRCGGIVATADTIYIASDSTKHPGKITAIDASTGARKWTTSAQDNRDLAPLRADGRNGGLIAYESPGETRHSTIVPGSAARVLHLNPATGTREVWLQLPDTGAESQDHFKLWGYENLPLFTAGRLYLRDTTVAPSIGNPPWTLAYGAATN
ncbi:hypothetical protein SRB5_11300 [Streptomyces sp. RB5]|uniref:Pyrrolo-quinoline quinone repeat domain-containing protein n=1 Tax=Streptomyces smaragdinus TaxID=2585196 RepID=A0A7K0CC74_9ACTN|nr:hypothetical protein [Streptomyces smaragdinus]